MTGPIGDNSAARLLSIVERWERLETEVKALRSDQADILKEAGSAGFKKKLVRKLLAERKADPAELELEEMELETLRSALRSLADTPLGAAALARVGV